MAFLAGTGGGDGEGMAAAPRGDGVPALTDARIAAVSDVEALGPAGASRLAYTYFSLEI